MAAIIAAVVGIVAGAAQGASSKEQAVAASRREKAALMMQTREEIRRRTGEFKFELGSAVAMAGASGFAAGKAGESVAAGGGFGNVMKAMEQEFSAESRWLMQSAAAGISAIDTATQRTLSAINTQVTGTVLSNVAMAGTARNWWQ